MHTIVLVSNNGESHRSLMDALSLLFPQSRIEVVHSHQRQSFLEKIQQGAGANRSSRSASASHSGDAFY